MESNISEQNIISEDAKKKVFVERLAVLKEIAEKLGYSINDYVQDLDLSSAEKDKLRYSNRNSDLRVSGWRRHLRAERKDGSSVKVVVSILRDESENSFAADIFSPAFFEGHASNHDYNQSDLEATLRTAVEGPLY